MIGDHVISMGNAVFQGCASLTSVTIGHSVTTIGSNAFNFLCRANRSLSQG